MKKRLLARILLGVQLVLIGKSLIVQSILNVAIFLTVGFVAALVAYLFRKNTVAVIIAIAFIFYALFPGLFPA